MKPNSPLNNSAEKITELIKGIQKTLRDKFFEMTKQYGFTLPQIGVIFKLNTDPFISLQGLSEHMGLSKSTVSGIIDRLVAQGVVLREIPPENRRMVRLSLSQEFVKNHNLFKLKEEYLNHIIRDAQPEELEIIIHGLEKLYSLITASQRSED